MPGARLLPRDLKSSREFSRPWNLTGRLSHVHRPLQRITFERRPTNRPERYELRLLIDGVDLCELVRVFELPFAAEGAGQYSGVQWYLPNDPAWLSRYYLGKPDYDWAGRTEILVCECGEPGCWPLTCRIRVTSTRVYWSDFAQPHRSGRRRLRWHPGLWDYTGFGPFVFERAQYEEALLAAQRGVARPSG